MSTQLGLDLRLARRKAGYKQADIAALLSTHQSVVSDLEGGELRPDLEQIVTLSLIYGRSFEDFFSEIMAESTTCLKERVARLPHAVRGASHTFNRHRSIAQLQDRLNTEQGHGSA